MELIKKHTHLFISVLFVLIYIGFWRIAVNTINTVRVEEIQEVKKSKPRDVVSANVILEAKSPNGVWKYDVRDYEELQTYSNDSLWDFIDKLKDMGELTYEQTEYVYGTKITEFNGIKSSDKMQWNIYANEKLINEDFDKIKLEENLIYTLKLE